MVDYMLRLQESIMDFYWHYSSKDVVDQQVYIVNVILTLASAYYIYR